MTTPMVLVTELPEGETPGSLTPPHDPTLRLVQAIVRPDMRRTASLAYDVLLGMGKNPGVRGGSHKDARDVTTRLAPWLLAHRTEWVVMFSAQEIPAKIIAGGLLDGAIAGGARVLLVADAHQRAVVHKAVAGYGATAYVDYREWAAQQGVRLGAATPEQSEVTDEGFAWDAVALPKTDWPWFRARCRDQLAPEHFAAVDDLYIHALRTVRDEAPDYPPKTQVPQRLDVLPLVAILGRLLDDRYTRAEGTVVLRAAQAALFGRGYLLRTEVDSMLNLLVDGDRPATLTDAQWQSLRAYQQQWRGAACALAASGYGVNDTLGLLMRDVDAARRAGTTALAGKTVDPRGWEFVMAQYFERVLEGADYDEPLFSAARTMITRALRDSRNDLGLRLGGYIPIKLGRTPEENWQNLAASNFILMDVR